VNHATNQALPNALAQTRPAQTSKNKRIFVNSKLKLFHVCLEQFDVETLIDLFQIEFPNQKNGIEF